jgi:ribosome-associated toxin RatA of RatAB toxin-antitoxin module
MAMEKYGVEQEMYEVVKEGKVIESFLPLVEAQKIAAANKDAVVVPSK